MVRRYIVLVNTQSSSVYDRIFDYCRYQTVNYVAFDGEGFLIDSYASPGEICDFFIENCSSYEEFFVCEITGEVAWRNASCGFNDMNRFLG